MAKPSLHKPVQPEKVLKSRLCWANLSPKKARNAGAHHSEASGVAGAAAAAAGGVDGAAAAAPVLASLL